MYLNRRSSCCSPTLTTFILIFCYQQPLAEEIGELISSSGCVSCHCEDVSAQCRQHGLHNATCVSIIAGPMAGPVPALTPSEAVALSGALYGHTPPVNESVILLDIMATMGLSSVVSLKAIHGSGGRHTHNGSTSTSSLRPQNAFYQA
jgi:hypothetical protein